MAQYDVVIIGGGIHGVGVAQAAAAAGYSVLVLEQSKLAAGSSSRSSKLIHGGLRYLESAQFSLVYECLHERQRLLKLAPELVRLEAFHIPIYKDSKRRPWQLRSGLSLYAMLGGLHRSSLFRRLSPSQGIQLDGLRTEGLQSVFRYYDGMSDDAALTRAVMHSAESLGAELQIQARFLHAQIEEDRVEISYQQGDQQKFCQAKILINAAGPWVNEVLGCISPAQDIVAVDMVQGSHLILDTELLAGSYYMDAPEDGRAIFFLPWKGKAMLGTTEIHYHGSPDDVHVLPEEREYLLRVAQHYFPALTGAAVVDEFSGLRILPQAQGGTHFSRPRDTRLVHNNRRLLSIYGGKLTTYRLSSEKVINQLQEILGPAERVAGTDKLTLEPV
ncbi:MAG: FAD-dependent oxidoreductase [Gammaproteobacteria bacterium]|nr:FAD-dependent oxidoreductase [Gammaproteobacteria bacterium]